MSQIAEDMIDGSCCSYCGQYFEHPECGIYVHEYPVLCKDCYTDESDIQIADVDTF